MLEEAYVRKMFPVCCQTSLPSLLNAWFRPHGLTGSGAEEAPQSACLAFPPNVAQLPFAKDIAQAGLLQAPS